MGNRRRHTDVARLTGNLAAFIGSRGVMPVDADSHFTETRSSLAGLAHESFGERLSHKSSGPMTSCTSPTRSRFCAEIAAEAEAAGDPTRYAQAARRKPSTSLRFWT